MTMLCQPSPNFESAQSAPNQLVNHTDEKTIQEGEINPSPATNSNGKSNYSIEEAPKVDKKPVESSLVSNVEGPNGPSPVINSTGKSNNSIEEAPKVDKTPAKLSLESNMTLSDHPLGKEIELSLSEQVAPAENDVSSKTKTSKLRSSSRKAKVIDPMPIPRRSSRRLAGVEADPVIDSIVNKPARSTKPKQQNSMPKELIRSESLQIQSAVDEGATTVNQSTINWPEFTETSPFGDSWPDPCIEFAFKTLTGDLPVLDDAMAIQEYFEQQLVAVERSSSSGSALLPDGKVEGPPSSTNFEKAPTKPDLQQRNDTTQMVTKER
ncbi:hypothetical protein AXF42_Ash009942 [Apostasia shenzhenica]|uniref:Uncharacterized protein n=1 Tax=Apostasia shenzhenica TaxID=1088818 RepID=A0A2I0ACD7_9ASPA|nr:hypothetical protein AXF42_Ash009942 [Apostasia shenzhenica]